LWWAMIVCLKYLLEVRFGERVRPPLVHDDVAMRRRYQRVDLPAWRANFEWMARAAIVLDEHRGHMLPACTLDEIGNGLEHPGPVVLEAFYEAHLRVDDEHRYGHASGDGFHRLRVTLEARQDLVCARGRQAEDTAADAQIDVVVNAFWIGARRKDRHWNRATTRCFGHPR
jgi:hypothetical protein